MTHPQRLITKRSICKRKKTTTTTTTLPGPYLPDDIIFFQILSKLPVRCLLRFKCVSKLWYNTIRDPNFHASYLTHAKANPSLDAILYSRLTFFICFLHLKKEEEEGGGHHHHPNSNIASLELKSAATHIAGTCNGLTLNVLSLSHIQISNPSTHELLNLSYPRLIKGIVSRGLGFDPLMNEYKVIHIWHDFRKYFGCMVYTFGANKWRSITATCNCPPSCFPMDVAPICINGTLFWRTNCNNHYILSFDLHHEKFQVIICPQVPQGTVCHTLFELRGCLCAVYRCNDNLKDEVQLSLYSLKDHHLLRLLLTKQQQQVGNGGAKWIRSVCYYTHFLKPDIEYIRFVEFARHTYLQWVTMDGHFILYDLNSNRVTHKKLMGVYAKQCVILVNHVENLLSLKTFVPSSAGEVEFKFKYLKTFVPSSAGDFEVKVKYVSSREAKHESPDHQQWEVQRKKRMKLVFNSHGLTNPSWFSITPI